MTDTPMPTAEERLRLKIVLTRLRAVAEPAGALHTAWTPISILEGWMNYGPTETVSAREARNWLAREEERLRQGTGFYEDGKEAAVKSRFDYVQFSDEAHTRNGRLTAMALLLEEQLNALPDSQEKLLALTKLEESVMWARKALRDVK